MSSSDGVSESAFEALHPALRYHIVNTLQWAALRPTQLQAIGPVQAGENVLLLAPTAGGKTEAALLPLLSRMSLEGWRGLSALYVCPLRALLNNLAPRAERYCALMGRRAGLWHGDVADGERRRILADHPDVLLTTPESLEAMLISVGIDHRALFGEVRSVIVDELHAFAGDDRGWHLLALLERLERLAGRRVQRIGLSATVGNPEELLAWLARGRRGCVVGPSRPPQDGDVTVDYVGSTENAVTVLARLFRGERRLVFADSRARVEELADGLRRSGVRTFLSHGSLSTDERRQAEAAFAGENDCVIVATSTLELGLDVGDLDRVIQLDAPPSAASFIQRMGRTGRRTGAKRNCLFLTTTGESLLVALALSSLWRSGAIEAVTAPARPSHIHAQQILAVILQEGGVAQSDLEGWFGEALDTVPGADRDAMTAHMLASGILVDDGGVLGIGPRGERELGRRHFSDLVAAFTSSLLLDVHHGTAELGAVHPMSLVRRDGAAAVLLLGGCSWKVEHVDWPRHRVAVVPAPEGGRSRWLGSARALPESICRAVERVLTGEEPACELSRRGSAELAEMRERFAFVDGLSMPVVRQGDSTRAWTFAGGKANAMLAGALRSRGLAVSSVDGFSITLREHDAGAVARHIGQVDGDASEPEVPDEMVAELKFAACLPSALATAILRERLSDFAALARALGRPRRLVHVAS